MRIFIDCHLYPISTTTYYYTPFIFSFVYGTSYLMGIVRIITTLFTICSKIFNFKSFRF